MAGTALAVTKARRRRPAIHEEMAVRLLPSHHHAHSLGRGAQHLAIDHPTGILLQ